MSEKYYGKSDEVHARNLSVTLTQSVGRANSSLVGWMVTLGDGITGAR